MAEVDSNGKTRISVMGVDPETSLPSPEVLDAWKAAILEDHLRDSNPHTAYDGAHSLTLLLQNGLI